MRSTLFEVAATVTGIAALAVVGYVLTAPAATAAKQASQVTAGGAHACALTVDAGVMCWGQNTSGQLGDNTTIDRPTPISVVGLSSGVTDISAGRQHTCAVTGAGGVQCWGENLSGQVGDGTNVDRPKPVDVVGLNSGIQAITAGSEHTCALTTAGGVKCWGTNNYSGQLGDGTEGDRWTPVDVVGLESGVISIVAGYRHTCALTTAGGVKCWGMNSSGQLGDGTNTDRSTPVDVEGLTFGVRAITADYGHTCALTDAGGVKCWGENNHWQLGDRTLIPRSIPVDVVGLESGVTAIMAGYERTCAVTSSEGVMCWGKTNVGTERPIRPVNGLDPDVVAIDAGYRYSCALTLGGHIECWGVNSSGQLGDGTTGDRWTPVKVAHFSDTEA